MTLKRFVGLDERHVEIRPDSHNPEQCPFGSTSPRTSCTSTASRSGRSSGGWAANASEVEPPAEACSACVGPINAEGTPQNA